MLRWMIATAFALLIPPTAAQAWGPVGHNTVCEIAWRDMTATTKAAVDRLVRADGQFRTFTKTCNYPDPPPQRRRGKEHFANYLRSAARVSGPGCPTHPACVMSAIENDLAVLRSSTASDRRKGQALKFIGHWFGDIHQPLHISFEDDIGGNSIDVDEECSGHLHRVWDSCIINRRIIGSAPARFRTLRDAVTGLHAEITSAERATWRGSEPWRWAKESYEITLRPETRYCVKKPNACWYDNDRLTFSGQKREVHIDPGYLDDAAPLVEGRLKRAAVRLAHALNKIFDPSYRG